MKTLIRAIAALLAIAVLAGCATGYQKRGLTGGYADSKIDDTHYIVKFDGNGFADKDRVWHFWIYRCAQLTKEKGFTYFSLEHLANKNASFNPDDDDRPQLTDTVLHGDADGHVIDVHGGGGVTYIYVPGQTITTWHSNAVVTMYNDDIPEQRAVYRAQTIIDALVDYIQTNGKSVPPDQRAISELSAFGLTADHRLVNIHQYMQEHPQVVRSRPRPPTTSPSLSAAQATASQVGCGDVRANGNSTFIAQCSSYQILISCDGGQCRPQHVIK